MKVVDISRVLDYLESLNDNSEIIIDEIPEEITFKMKEVLGLFEYCGFALLQGHGINREVFESAFYYSKQLFDLSLQEKQSLISKDKARRGYSPLNDENFGILAGSSREPNDLVEKFRIGPIDTYRDELDDSYLFSKEGRIHFFENIWPNNLNGVNDEFKETLTEYYMAMSKLALQLIKIIEISLSIDGHYHGVLANSFKRHTSILTINNYGSLHDEQIDDANNRIIGSNAFVRVASHYDVSMLTIVAQKHFNPDRECSENTILQLHNQKVDIWEDVTCLQDDVLIVNIGDCLQDWSRLRLKSTMHRVISPFQLDKYSQRLSIAYFATPSYDVVMRNFTESSEKQLDNDITYSKWRVNRIKNALKVKKLK